MFFWPTLSQLRAAGVTISILCLSTGNFDGLGGIRKREPQQKKVCCVWGWSSSMVDRGGLVVCIFSSSSGTRTQNFKRRMQGDGEVLHADWFFGLQGEDILFIKYRSFSGFTIFCKKRRNWRRLTDLGRSKAAGPGVLLHVDHPLK